MAGGIGCRTATGIRKIPVVPRIIIRTGFTDSEGREEQLSEYLCDAPSCPNIASQVHGSARELGLFTAVCDQHLSPDVVRKTPHQLR